MAEEQNNQAANGAQANQPQLSLQRIYVKDLSFESPKAPAIFQTQWNPHVNLDLNTRNTELQPGIYEVVLSVNATVTTARTRPASSLKSSRPASSPSTAWKTPRCATPWAPSARTFCSPMHAKRSTIWSCVAASLP